MIESVLFKQGMVKVKENDHNGAISIFSKILEEDPKNADALSQRAVAYLNIEKYDLSMVDMNRAIEYDPDYAFRYQCRGYLKARIQDYEGAVADYEKAVELNPEDGIAYNNLALAQEQLGYAKQSKRNFEKSDKIMGIKPRKIENADEALKKEGKTDPIEQTKKVLATSGGNTTKEKSTKEKKELAKAVFTDKNSFKDFIQFIKNGFKLKK